MIHFRPHFSSHVKLNLFWNWLIHLGFSIVLLLRLKLSTMNPKPAQIWFSKLSRWPWIKLKWKLSHLHTLSSPRLFSMHFRVSCSLNGQNTDENRRFRKQFQKWFILKTHRFQNTPFQVWQVKTETIKKGYEK